MRTGKTINELAVQISAEQKAKRDFITPTTKLEYSPDGGDSGSLRFEAGGDTYETQPTRHCLNQIGSHTGIPQKYLDRMTGDRENRELLARNINHWFAKEPSKRMLRTLINGQQTARAFLSDRYRPLDNMALAEAVLPRLADAGCQVVSSEITETRLYIQAATPRIELDINALRAAGTKLSDVDPVQAGIVISNSEVGQGRVRIESLLYRLRCFNGMILPFGMKKNHVGRSNGGELENTEEYFSDATRELDDRAFWAKVTDTVAGMFDLGRFTSLAQKFADASSVQLPGVMEAVEIVSKRFNLGEEEGKSVLDHLAAGGDMSLFGLVNAVTRTAEDVKTYDRAIEFERMGGEILELPQTIWGKN